MRTLLFTLLLGWSALAPAADLTEPVILVAKPELRGTPYAATILVVTPVGGGQHLGFIVNRPTEVTLGRLFPEHGPSQKVAEPVYLGGPLDARSIIALVRRPDSPGGKSLEVVQGLPLNEFSRGKIDASINELKEERSMVGELLPKVRGDL